MSDAVNSARGFGRGTAHPKAKLSEADVLQIDRLVREGCTHEYLGRAFGVDRSAISAIATGRSWSHVTGRRNQGLVGFRGGRT